MQDLKFSQAVLILAREYEQLFENEASAREIGMWVERIPKRCPKYKVGELWEAVKKTVNEGEGMRR